MLRLHGPTSTLSTLLMLACVQRPALVVETSTGDIVPLESWTATLSSNASHLSGIATLSPGATHRESTAHLALRGATSGARHAWYVQLGECGRDLGILAGPQSYAPIVIDAMGNGESTLTLPFTVPTTGHYFVSVRAADSESAPTIACGNLTRRRVMAAPAVARARTR
jgi:hypothetical protein